MDELEYSNEALEVISDFYNCDFTIFVEGEDDVLFWRNVFTKNKKNVHIEEVGGCEELKKYINKIQNENVNIYVAKDSDYSDFQDDVMLNNERIFRTYGHSIENTLYNLPTIKKIINNYSRKDENYDDKLNEIIENFETKIKPILIYDIINDVYGKGISILGNNTCKFLKNNNSIHLCEEKIENFITSKCNSITETEIQTVTEKLNNYQKPLWFVLRGHFLTNFVINIIKHFVKQISNKTITIPLESLYPLFIPDIDSSSDFSYYTY
jgi:hypothetical protein